MNQAFICDAIRTPFGRYGGALSSVRTDDLAAIPLMALMARNPKVDWAAVTDVIFGCVNQAGEDNRNVAHMSSLLAGLPIEVPGATINRSVLGFCATAQANACSRPPDPKIRIFIAFPLGLWLQAS
jgi:acetyl-CoA acetyltransferase